MRGAILFLIGAAVITRLYLWIFIGRDFVQHELRDYLWSITGVVTVAVLLFLLSFYRALRLRNALLPRLRNIPQDAGTQGIIDVSYTDSRAAKDAQLLHSIFSDAGWTLRFPPMRGFQRVDLSSGTVFAGLMLRGPRDSLLDPVYDALRAVGLNPGFAYLESAGNRRWVQIEVHQPLRIGLR